MGLHKTSNRLLAAMVAGVVALVCFIYLDLYARYRQGHIVTRRQLERKAYTPYHPHRPAVLSLDGTVWVNLYPSDSFYIELPKADNPAGKPWLTGQTGPEETLQLPQYRESGDTLLITGSFTDPLHRPFSDPSYRNFLPQVNIYGRDLKDIRLLDGQMVIYGSDSAAGAPAIHLTAINSTVWVANLNESTHYKAYFDSLDLRLSNTILLLNPSAIIRTASIRLDSNSELNDRWSTVGRLTIDGHDSSHIGLAGNNLKHATIDIH